MKSAASCEHLAPYMRRCDVHGDDAFACPDILFVRRSSGGYAIPVRDGGSSMVPIRYCPFCGARLDPSKEGG